MRTDGLGTRHSALGLLMVLGASGCGDSSAPAATTIPGFVYVATIGGNSQLVRWRNDTTTALTSVSNNYDPNSRASRLVFTSERNGQPQIFIADLDLVTAHQVTNMGELTRSASLSPNGDSIAFVVSSFAGAPRVYVIAAAALTATTFDSAAALATGTTNSVPEDAPAWKPTGGSIAFSSVRGGVSQIFVVPSGGGAATQVTHEIAGAFQPAWSEDGSRIYYVAYTPRLILRWVGALGGFATTVVNDPADVAGPASCNGALCLFNTDPTGTGGNMCAYVFSAARSQLVFPRTAEQEREPAILVP